MWDEDVLLKEQGLFDGDFKLTSGIRDVSGYKTMKWVGDVQSDGNFKGLLEEKGETDKFGTIINDGGLTCENSKTLNETEKIDFISEME